MYDPKGNGKDRTVDTVQFVEAKPPVHLQSIVHRFLELSTDTALPNDYRFHALPDACTYIVFDQQKPHITGVTQLQASSEELNLGRDFHFVNIRFLPGVWKNEVAYGLVNTPYSGGLPLVSVNKTLLGESFSTQQTILSDFVDQLVDQQLVMANPVTE